MTKQRAVVLDLVLVALFALIGYVTHHHRFDPAGVFRTAMPFLAALLAGWAALLLLRRAGTTLSDGLVLWLVTLVGGMLLRLAGGDTARTPFVVVATVVLALFLLGWRVLLRRWISPAAPAGASRTRGRAG